MKTYTFWNNKGGTGKTSLCFQTILQYAANHPQERILAIDLCPQANLSEYLLGGLFHGGSANLQNLWTQPAGRRSIGGYFYDHIPSAYMMFAGFSASSYICNPNTCVPNNAHIPINIDLLAGDSYVEELSNSISALASTNIPQGDAYIKVISWIVDFIHAVQDQYATIFIDTNPSFSIYTQMAIAASEKLIIPVTADNSSIRALNNVLALVYGINPNGNQLQNTFTVKMANNNLPLPQIHMVVRNRLTQYMGPASAYSVILSSLNNTTNTLKGAYPNLFSNNFSILDVYDFNTFGQIAFAETKMFSQVNVGYHVINNKRIMANQQGKTSCVNSINQIVARL